MQTNRYLVWQRAEKQLWSGHLKAVSLHGAKSPIFDKRTRAFRLYSLLWLGR
jgi:hypothetical protein